MMHRNIPIADCILDVKKWNPIREAPDRSFTYLDISSVNQDAKKIENYSVLKGKNAPSRARQLLIKNDVIVSTIRPNLNAVALTPDEFDGATASTGFCILRADAKKLSSRYLYHWVRTPEFVSSMTKQAIGQSYPAVSDSIVKNSTIPLPPLDEQKRIATILDQADDLRRLRQSAIDRLNTLGQSIFYEMFGEKIFNSSKSKHVELRELACSLQNGAYFPKERYATNGTEMVHMSDAFSGMVSRGHLKRVIATPSEAKKYNLTDRDILIARRSLTLEGAAKPCLVPSHKDPLLFESSFIRITPLEKVINHIYLYYYLDDPKIKEIALRPFITQSTISGINQSNLAKVPVYVPPIKEQLEFEDRIKILSENKATNGLNLLSLQTLFFSLQQRAFRGEL